MVSRVVRIAALHVTAWLAYSHRSPDIKAELEVILNPTETLTPAISILLRFLTTSLLVTEITTENGDREEAYIALCSAACDEPFSIISRNDWH